MDRLVNENIMKLMSYKPGRAIEEIERLYKPERIVKMASNENPFPLPDRVVESVRKKLGQLTLYPDSESYYLKKRIAEYNGIGFDNILVGAGSLEIIKMIPKVFLKKGEKVLTSEKTFIFYKIAAIEARGASSFIESPMDENYRYSIQSLNEKIDDSVKIIFIANPNNPTGTALDPSKLREFILSIPESKIIVLDNAYQEYVENRKDYLTCIDLIGKKRNLIILRTFSKVYGLAGLRVGYALGNKEIITLLNRVKPPFNVSIPAQAAALSSLENNEFRDSSRIRNLENRKQLESSLRSAGFKVIPSDTNFLMFLPGTDVSKLNDKLLKKGVIVRPLSAFGIPDAIRVTVGTAEDNKYFLDKLFEAL